MSGRGRALPCAAAAALVMLTGCASSAPSAPVSSVHAAASLSPSGRPATGAARQALAARYLAIAVAGNRRLEIDFDRLDGRDRSDLAAARADLRDAAATESLFDHRLAGIAFPASTEEIVRLLITSNQARSRLTLAAAGSASLAQLRGYERQLTAANGPVEDAVTVIRSQLGLPPPDTS